MVLGGGGLLTLTPQGALHCDSLRSGRKLDVSQRDYFRQVLATREFDQVQPCATDDAEGGVAAAQRAAQSLLAALADWVRQLACQCAPTGAHLHLLPEQDAPPPGASLRRTPP